MIVLHHMSPARALALVVLAAFAGGQRTTASLQSRVSAYVDSQAAALITLRRDLHRHPELSGQELRTSGIVAERLKALGLQVRTRVGGLGVVGTLIGRRPGPLVAYRADMDAVRSHERDPVEFRSVVEGVRHICGHDVHVTIGLGLAAALASLRADLPGRVMFIFQPSEERATGAQAMLDAGLFNERPSAIFGLHTAPLAVGRVASKAGQMMYPMKLPNTVVPGVTNDASLYAASRADLIAAMGEAAFVELQQLPQGVSEDFGHFQSRVPGVFFFLGVGAAGMPHSPGYVVDEAAIPFGIKAMAAVVVGRLRSGS
jgi:metal-dependent amidase/aminoacylase/carboxypeptidase family protein